MAANCGDLDIILFEQSFILFNRIIVFNKFFGIEMAVSGISARTDLYALNAEFIEILQSVLK